MAFPTMVTIAKKRQKLVQTRFEVHDPWGNKAVFNIIPDNHVNEIQAVCTPPDSPNHIAQPAFIFDCFLNFFTGTSKLFFFISPF